MVLLQVDSVNSAHRAWPQINRNTLFSSDMKIEKYGEIEIIPCKKLMGLGFL